MAEQPAKDKINFKMLLCVGSKLFTHKNLDYTSQLPQKLNQKTVQHTKSSKQSLTDINNS